MGNKPRFFREPQKVEYLVVGIDHDVESIFFEDHLLSTPNLRVRAPKPFGYRRINPAFLRDFNALVTLFRPHFQWYIYRVHADGHKRLVMVNYPWRPNIWWANDTAVFESLPFGGDSRA